MKEKYELRPVNFFNLNQEGQNAVLGDFVSLLNLLTSLTSFHIKTDASEVNVLDKVIRQPYKRYFVESDEPVMISGLRYSKVLEVPSLKIKGTARNFMVLEGGKLARVFNVYSIPSRLQAGFLVRYYDFADEIRLDVRPVPEADREVERQFRSVNARLENIKEVDARSKLYLSALDNARLSVSAGTEKLFEVRLTFTVVAESYEQLREKSINLRKFLDYAEAPSHIQPALYTLSGPKYSLGKWLYMTTGGLATFFPFAGMDLVDPNGTFIGRNMQTGNYVIFDVFERDNYNISLLGQTGYGKSMFIKAYLSRLAQVDDKSAIFAFDSIVKPEYAGDFAKAIGAVVMRLEKNETYNLDPFKIFSSRDASEFVRELVKLDEGSEEAVELFSLGKEVKSINELISRADGSLKKRLEAELDPVMRFFSGETKIYDRMVFTLSDIESPFVRDAVAFLLLGAVWSTVKEMPLSTRKFMVIDEGWAFVETNPRTGKPYFPMTVEYIPEIARTGRHYSAAFIMASQLVSDFVGGQGRVMLENSASKVLLRQNSASAKMLKEALDLADDEFNTVMSAKPGEGILIVPEGHVPFFNLLLTEELKKFTTKNA